MEENEEIWREVEGSIGYYVSNKNKARNHNNIFLKGWMQRGYRYIGFANGVKHPFHLVVAKAFPEICGEWFEGCVVHHKDFDKLNNVPENLVVITQSEHAALHYETQPDTFKKCTDKRRNSISEALKGKRHTKQGEFVRRYDCLMDVAKYGFDSSTICSVCKGQLKSSKGYIWKYEKEEE